MSNKLAPFTEPLPPPPPENSNKQINNLYSDRKKYKYRTYTWYNNAHKNKLIFLFSWK